MTSSVRGARTAIVFDLDGTMVDSLPDISDALNRTLAEFGRAPVVENSVRGWLGDGVSSLVDRGLKATGGMPSGMTLDSATERFRHFYRGHTTVRSALFPNVETTLRRLKDNGHRLGVCTNKPFSLAMEVVDGFGIASLFDAILGGDSLDIRKPDPRHLTGTLAAMGVGDEPALMVGDSANDVKTARAAGIPVVVMSFGYSAPPAAELGADAVLDDFAALLTLPGTLLTV